MPLWTDRLTAKCHHLSDAEYGLYVRLLIELWQAPGQRLPYDAAWLGRRFRRTAEQAAADIFPLIDEFCTRTCGGKFFTQKTVIEQFEYLKSRREKQSIRSKARWDKDKDLSRGNADTHASGNAASGNALSTPTPTHKDKNTDVDDARATLNLVGNRVMDIMQVRDDPRWFGNYSLVEVWLKRGCDPDLDIYPTVTAVMAKRNGHGPPSNLKYFDRAIMQAYADRTRILPEAMNGAGTHQTRKPKRTQESDRAAILAAFDLDAGSSGLESDERSGGPIIEGDYHRSD